MYLYNQQILLKRYLEMGHKRQPCCYNLFKISATIEPMRPVPITATVKSRIDCDNIEGSQRKS